MNYEQYEVFKSTQLNFFWQSSRDLVSSDRKDFWPDTVLILQLICFLLPAKKSRRLDQPFFFGTEAEKIKKSTWYYL